MVNKGDIYVYVYVYISMYVYAYGLFCVHVLKTVFLSSSQPSYWQVSAHTGKLMHASKHVTDT
jgi:hypothetical protein